MSAKMSRSREQNDVSLGRKGTIGAWGRLALFAAYLAVLAVCIVSLCQNRARQSDATVATYIHPTQTETK